MCQAGLCVCQAGLCVCQAWLCALGLAVCVRPGCMCQAGLCVCQAWLCALGRAVCVRPGCLCQDNVSISNYYSYSAVAVGEVHEELAGDERVQQTGNEEVHILCAVQHRVREHS